MSYLRPIAAALAGYSLHELLVFTGGISAALGTPHGYFEYFGREHQTAALGLWSLGTFAVPQFALAALATWVLLRVLGTSTAAAVALVLGALLSWLSYMLYATGPHGSPELVTPTQFLQLLSAIYLQANWQLPVSWSVWLGIAAGIALARKGARKPHASSTAEA